MQLGLSRPLVIVAAIIAASTHCAVAGQPSVHVDTDEKVNAAHVRASIDIAAPPAAVWGVITDCARQPQIVPNLESCRIVKHDPAGRWDIREHIINWAALMPKLRTVVRTSYDGIHRMLFKRVDGDMRISEGEWRIEPTANARASRLYYTALVAPKMPVPQFMIEHAVQNDLPNILRAIERASVADAAKRVSKND
jgi:ribosome-associated toxin RatA of RatAB toxin-antitoxin module